MSPHLIRFYLLLFKLYIQSHYFEIKNNVYSCFYMLSSRFYFLLFQFMRFRVVFELTELFTQITMLCFGCDGGGNNSTGNSKRSADKKV